MAPPVITFVLVARGPNHLVYLATTDQLNAGEAFGIIQATGAGNADVSLQAAAVPPAGANYNAGLLKQIVDLTNVTTQDIARRQLLDRGLAPVVGDGIINVPGKRCRADIMQVVPSMGQVLRTWGIDADSNGAGRGEYIVYSGNFQGIGSALVRIEAIGTPQQF